jgi:hypothetical protein
MIRVLQLDYMLLDTSLQAMHCPTVSVTRPLLLRYSRLRRAQFQGPTRLS